MQIVPTMTSVMDLSFSGPRIWLSREKTTWIVSLNREISYRKEKLEGLMSSRNILDIKVYNWLEFRAFTIARRFSSEN